MAVGPLRAVFLVRRSFHHGVGYLLGRLLYPVAALCHSAGRVRSLLAVLAAIGLVLCIPFRAWELSHGKHIVWSAKTLAAILYVGILLAGLRQSLHTRLIAGRHLECR